jgi:hypothetical protein
MGAHTRYTVPLYARVVAGRRGAAFALSAPFNPFLAIVRTAASLSHDIQALRLTLTLMPKHSQQRLIHPSPSRPYKSVPSSPREPTPSPD